MSAYLEKYAVLPKLIEAPPAAGLELIVVIPCHNEKGLRYALESLYSCTRPACNVEVITVINASENDSDLIRAQNIKTWEEAEIWHHQNSTEGLTFHTVLENYLPAKHAGVGLARKLGMDEALRRFDQVGQENGIIINFDADCTCESNLLTEVYRAFRSDGNLKACSIRFEHPTFGSEYDSKTYLGISLYELHLRYYNLAMGYTGFPWAYHTIGSAMACTAAVYRQQGGMNRRQAGEDFYFLHKLIPLGNFKTLNTTKVIPSPRASDRVPFGTGKAINEYLKSGSSEFFTYNLQGFRYLKQFFKNIPEFYLRQPELEKMGGVLPYVLIDFLNTYFFDERIAEIRSNSANINSFTKRFFTWFNAFMILKFIHFVRDNAHPNVPVQLAAMEFLRELKYPGISNIQSLSELLGLFRRIDAEGKFWE